MRHLIWVYAVCSGMSIPIFMVIMVAPVKGIFINQNVLIFFLFLHENICCGYSLEAPHRGASNEYHNICFHEEIKKNIYLVTHLI